MSFSRIAFHFFRFRSRIGGRVAVMLGVTALAGTVRAQARLVLNNDGWVRIDNGAWVVVENSATTGVQTLGTGGNIRSEGELNRLRWQIRNTVGTYVVPFTASNGTKMPLTYRVATAGSAETTASICFSTYNHASAGVGVGDEWNNDLYRPSDVTHMNRHNSPAGPNSAHAVDRFWIIDPGVAGYAYGTRPSIEMDITYDPNAADGEVMPGNAIVPGTPVAAQRFNSSAGLWGDYLPNGVFSAGAVNTVSGVVAGPDDFFRSWTLADFLEPLPVVLMRFAAECEGRAVELSWSTASESNSAYFQVERSNDGMSFVPLGRVAASGNGWGTQDYRFIDRDVDAMFYYRLRQVDTDGHEEFSGIVVSECMERGGLEILNAWDDGHLLNVMVASHGFAPVLSLWDVSGRQVYTARVGLSKGVSSILIPKEGSAPGVYLVRLDAPGASVSRRVVIGP